MRSLNLRDLTKSVVLQLLAPIGKMIGRFYRPSDRFDVISILPHYHMAGAEIVHLEIMQSLADQRLCIVFTRKSPSQALLDQFRKCGRIVDLSGWESNPLLAAIAAGMIACWARRSPHTRLFGSNSFLYFKVIRLVAQDTQCIDLTHSFDRGIEVASLSVAERINRRIVIHEGLVSQFGQLYRSAGLPASLLGRLTVIHNRIPDSSSQPEKASLNPLIVLYVGRNTPEKRAHIVARAASIATEQRLPVAFEAVGRFDNLRWPDGVLVHGEITQRDRLKEIYRRAHVILLTSNREGMPLSIMEGMAQGAAPVCTPVGDLPNHIVHARNGWLIDAPDDDSIAEDIVTVLEGFIREPDILRKISHEAYQYAIEHFIGSIGPEYRKEILASGQAA